MTFVLSAVSDIFDIPFQLDEMSVPYDGQTSNLSITPPISPRRSVLGNSPAALGKPAGLSPKLTFSNVSVHMTIELTFSNVSARMTELRKPVPMVVLFGRDNNTNAERFAGDRYVYRG
jgi:hypothetical protein